MTSPHSNWRLVQRVSHWIALVATIAATALALILVYPPEWSDHYIQRYTAGIEGHKWLGVVAAFAVLSLLIVHDTRPTREGDGAQRIIAALTQWGLLVLTPSVALLGYVASSFYGGALRIPGFGALPSPLPYNEQWGAPLTTAHDWLAYALIALAALHALAAAIHLASGTGRIVTRMLFGDHTKETR